MSVLNAVFLALLLAYLIHAVVSNRRDGGDHGRPLTTVVLLLQTPLFVLACVEAAQRGVFDRRLVFLPYIVLGLLAGHLIFGVSLLATHGILRDTLAHFFDLRTLGRFLVECPMLMIRFFVLSVTEEMIYRAAAQPLLVELTGRPWAAILVVALAFSMVHKHFFRNPLPQSIEFLTFAVLLGALYYWSGSLILVVVIHSLRNLESVYLEYLIKVDELGGEAKALQAIEAEYARVPERT